MKKVLLRSYSKILGGCEGPAAPPVSAPYLLCILLKSTHLESLKNHKMITKNAMKK